MRDKVIEDRLVMPAKEQSKHQDMSNVLISQSGCNPLIAKAIFKNL